MQEELRQGLLRIHGERGLEWLDHLPTTIDDVASQWSLQLAEPLESSYSHVVRAVRGDSRCVLKLSLPGNDVHSEAVALQHFDGVGAARLLEVDLSKGALLLQEVLPGIPLSVLIADDEDDAAMVAAASVILRLGSAPQPASTTSMLGIENDIGALAWLRACYDGGSGPLPEAVVARAERTAADLLQSAPAPVVLHRDLHPGNILRSDDTGWLAIDPKGRIGETACEAAAVVRNPESALVATDDPAKVIDRRVSLLTEQLGLDRERVLGWSCTLAIVAACWHLEDTGGGWEPALRLAEAMATLPGCP